MDAGGGVSVHTLGGLAISDRDADSLAQRILRDTVPAELFVAVVEALHAAHQELEQLVETEIPWTDDEVKELKLAHDLQLTLESAPEEWKPRLREIYSEVVAEGLFDVPGGPTPTLMPGTLESFGELWELLRRAALTQPGVDAALRQAVVHE